MQTLENWITISSYQSAQHHDQSGMTALIKCPLCLYETTKKNGKEADPFCPTCGALLRPKHVQKIIDSIEPTDSPYAAYMLSRYNKALEQMEQDKEFYRKQ